MVAWKELVASKWDEIQVLSSASHDDSTGASRTGDRFSATAVLDTKGLGESIGVELVYYKEVDGEHIYQGRKELKVVKREGDVYTYELKDQHKESGVYRYAFRMYPKNPNLTYRQDFAYVRWF
jgi:starch phosphorylase